MPNNISAPSSSFASLLWGLDYVPIVSTVKVPIDFFATRYWNPGKYDELSFYAKTYFDHLAEKENSRYIAVIPVIGNGIVLIQDCYDAVIKHEKERIQKSAEAGDTDAIEKLYRGTPEEKAKALECYYKTALDRFYGNASSARRILLKIVCGKEGEEKKKVLAWFLTNIKGIESFYYADIYNKTDLPQELRTKIVDLEIAEALQSKTSQPKYSLYNFLKKVSAQDKTRALAIVMRAAEAGNAQAFDYMETELVLNTSSAASIFQWIAKQAETLSSPMNAMAWKSLKDKFYSSKRESVIASYLRMLLVPQLPKDRFSEIVSALDHLAWMGTPQEKAQILTGYLRAAESGNVKAMYKVGKMYQAAGQENSAVHWFDKAAHANHVSSILAVARICATRGDVQGAAFWLEKASGRCDSPSKRLEYGVIKMWINRSRQSGPGAGFSDHQRADADNRRQQARQRAEQQRAQAEQSRAERKRAEAAAIKVKLTPIIGEFSTAQELQQKWRRWSLKTHPDRVKGHEEEFKRVTNLVEEYKALQNWS